MHRSITTTVVVIGAMLIPAGGSMVNGDWTPGPPFAEATRASHDRAQLEAVTSIGKGLPGFAAPDIPSGSARTTPRFRVSTASLTRSQLASITRGTDDGRHMWDWPDA